MSHTIPPPRHGNRGHACRSFLLLLAALMGGVTVPARDQPQWGSAWNRSLCSGETKLPSTFDPKSGLNVKWATRLGTETYSTPIVAGGRVYVGTNNGEPRDPRHQGDRGVMMCFEEATGKLLWQLVVPKRDEDIYMDWPKTGMASSVTVEGNRVYLMSNRGEVMCLDARGMANGNDGPFLDEGRHMAPASKPAMEPGPLDADILWTIDLPSAAGTWPHDSAHSSILIHGNHLYLNSATGVDNTHKKIRTPDAPSLVVIDKRTGKLLARDRENIAPRIFHCTWSSPSMGVIAGRPTLFFAGGDGIVYGFEPLARRSSPGELRTLKRVWRFDPDPGAPKENVHLYNTNRRESPSNIYSMPVFQDGRLYFTVGGDLWWGKNEAWMKCVTVEGSTDDTSKSEIWSVPLNKHSLSTPAPCGDLVFVADTGRVVHCVDRKSGKTLWTHEAKGEFWGSPLVADGKVFIGSRRSDFLILRASREKEVLATVELDAPISCTATAANRTLFIATLFTLYAIQLPPN